MDIPDLLSRITEYGGRVTFEDGTLNLVKPRDPYWRKRIVDDLLPLLAEHRSGLLHHFRGSSEDDPGKRCRGCGVRVWVGDGVTPRDVWLGCAVVACPWGRGGQ